jgi:hypothetical protein
MPLGVRVDFFAVLFGHLSIIDPGSAGSTYVNVLFPSSSTWSCTYLSFSMDIL